MNVNTEKQGARHMDDVQNTEAKENTTQTVDTGNTTPQEAGRTFTQDEVNRIVQERLAKERNKQDLEKDEALAAVTAQLESLQRKVLLESKGIPDHRMASYIKLAEVYIDDDTDFSAALDMALAEFPYQRPPMYAAGTGTNRMIGNPDYDDPVREGMGLNKKE